MELDWLIDWLITINVHFLKFYFIGLNFSKILPIKNGVFDVISGGVNKDVVFVPSAALDIDRFGDRRQNLQIPRA